MYLSRTITIRRRLHLLHWDADEGTYFVTFRLYDALPAKRHRLRWKELEQELDRGAGAQHLAVPAIGARVFDAIRFFDGERYWLHSACVMPNHVHVVLRLASGVRLPDVVRSWKSFTAREANRILGRSGRFWDDDWFDWLIRDARDLERVNAYVANNPAKAGLCEWPWVQVWQRPFVVRYEAGKAGRRPATHDDYTP